MVPWVVLGIMIAIGLLISVIYTAVVFFIDGFVLTGVIFLICGLICSGKCSRVGATTDPTECFSLCGF